MSRQYITAKFRPGDGMAYTYHHDGPPLLRGDKVLVSGKGGKGTRTVTVDEVGVPKPPFDTKPTLGRAPDEPEAPPTQEKLI